MVILERTLTEQRFWLHGEVDLANAQNLRLDLYEVIRESFGDLVIDCTDLRFIDASGLTALVDARNVLDAQRRAMRIVRLPAVARRAIDAVGLTAALGVED